MRWAVTWIDALTDSLEKFVAEKLDQIRDAGLYRRIVTTERHEDGSATREGRHLISFCCNDYLNLSQHPEVKRRAVEAILRYGAGAGGSRLITGNHPLYAELEARLAKLKETEDAIVFGSGYMANIGIIPALAGEGDVIFIDELSHACLFAGAHMSRAAVHVFRHNDMGDLERLLQTHRVRHPHALLLTDGVFSMDGDLAPLAALVPLAEQYDVWLLTDDAHGIGLLGEGRGSSFMGGEKARVPLQMGTLSKAIGGYGGYLCASRPVIDFMRNRARSLIFTTGLPPATIAAAIAALDVIESDPDLRVRPLTLARLFCRELNLADPQTCIVPVIVGDPDRAVEASEKLRDQGFLISAIRPPTVPEGTARLRITFTASHREADVRRLAAAIRSLGLAGGMKP